MKTFKEWLGEKELNDSKGKPVLSSIDEAVESVTEAEIDLKSKPKNFKEFLGNMRKQSAWISVDAGDYRGVLDLSVDFKSEDKKLKYQLILFSNATSRPVILSYNVDSDLIKNMTDVDYAKSGHWNSIGAFYLSETQALEVMKHFKKIFQTNNVIKSQIKKMWEEDYYKYSNLFELFNKSGVSDISKNGFLF